MWHGIEMCTGMLEASEGMHRNHPPDNMMRLGADKVHDERCMRHECNRLCGTTIRHNSWKASVLSKLHDRLSCGIVEVQ